MCPASTGHSVSLQTSAVCFFHSHTALTREAGRHAQRHQYPPGVACLWNKFQHLVKQERATRASPWSIPGSSEQSFVSSGHGQAIATATITSTHTGKETSKVPDSPTRASLKTLNIESPGIRTEKLVL
ncbi:hypothetical protein Bpfe_029348 [Biomphalaria pfeifferi]|uniref:Uncharacterized protein n=1 Tax=Biomphalaria pfeifferi TaxID=112525 RepID=A0AAD8EWD3_BIOPF|nr:hypothetical protein Bpfe_029348 [Biomphalaria pfeifferi]